MQNYHYSADQKPDADALGDAEFHALTARPGRHPSPALLLALAQIFVHNSAPKLWEIDQFQELMLNLLPFADAATHQELARLLGSHLHTPTSVINALKSEPADERPKQSPPQTLPKSVPVQQQQPNYQIDRLKGMLPLQISKRMAQVVAMAAKRGDRHVLRSVLASHLAVSRDFANYLLTNQDGLFLATALRALRMPSPIAHTILLAREGLECRDLIYVPHMVKSFERLEPEACRKRLKDWEAAFCANSGQSQESRNAAKHQPNQSSKGTGSLQQGRVHEVRMRISEYRRKAG
ncbi:MAG: hypothetical protein V7703_05755 [Hyphomicrobiales bacterium]